jgi:hypothetical protein
MRLGAAAALRGISISFARLGRPPAAYWRSTAARADHPAFAEHGYAILALELGPALAALVVEHLTPYP